MGLSLEGEGPIYLRIHQPAVRVVTPICMDRAVRLNRYYARSLGWAPHVRSILRLLGLGTYLPNEQTFAEAVARWQRRNGLPAHGILVPACWSRMLIQVYGPRVDLSGFVPGLGAPDEFLCVAGGTHRLNTVVVDGVTNTRVKAAETPAISSPVCRATTRCPTAFQPPHLTQDATHFVSLDRSMIRIVELAGLFGVDLAAITGRRVDRVPKKAEVAVKSLPSAPPLAALSFVAILSRGQREVHIHRIPDSAPRPVQSIVGGNDWDSLPFQATPGTAYTLIKRRWFEASLHRQWGKKAAIAWVVGLCNFYRDQTGVRLGIGDISHVVGEKMTDHGSHKEGVDVDAYVLDYPGTSTYPEPYFCEGTSTTALTLKTMAPPASASGSYDPASGTRLTGTHETTTWRRYATVLAYCFATWKTLKTFTWHGVTRAATQADAIAIAEAAFDSGWKSSWGPAPASRADVAPPATERKVRLIGQGVGNYGPGKGWPLHQDHMHIRLDV